LTLANRQRFASKGGYVVHLGEAKGGRLVVDRTGWRPDRSGRHYRKLLAGRSSMCTTSTSKISSEFGGIDGGDEVW